MLYIIVTLIILYMQLPPFKRSSFTVVYPNTLNCYPVFVYDLLDMFSINDFEESDFSALANERDLLTNTIWVQKKHLGVIGKYLIVIDANKNVTLKRTDSAGSAPVSKAKISQDVGTSGVVMDMSFDTFYDSIKKDGTMYLDVKYAVTPNLPKGTSTVLTTEDAILTLDVFGLDRTNVNVTPPLSNFTNFQGVTKETDNTLEVKTQSYTGTSIDGQSTSMGYLTNSVASLKKGLTGFDMQMEGSISYRVVNSVEYLYVEHKANGSVYYNSANGIEDNKIETAVNTVWLEIPTGHKESRSMGYYIEEFLPTHDLIKLQTTQANLRLVSGGLYNTDIGTSGGGNGVGSDPALEKRVSVNEIAIQKNVADIASANTLAGKANTSAIANSSSIVAADAKITTILNTGIGFDEVSSVPMGQIPTRRDNCFISTVDFSDPSVKSAVINDIPVGDVVKIGELKKTVGSIKSSDPDPVMQTIPAGLGFQKTSKGVTNIVESDPVVRVVKGGKSLLYPIVDDIAVDSGAGEVRYKMHRITLEGQVPVVGDTETITLYDIPNTNVKVIYDRILNKAWYPKPGVDIGLARGCFETSWGFKKNSKTKELLNALRVEINLINNGTSIVCAVSNNYDGDPTIVEQTPFTYSITFDIALS